MPSLGKFSKSMRAIVRNPNIDLQSMGVYSKADLQHRNRKIQEILTEGDNEQRHSRYQSLGKRNLLKQPLSEISKH